MKEVLKNLCKEAIKSNRGFSLGDSVEILEIKVTKKKPFYFFDDKEHFIVRANVNGLTLTFDVGRIGNEMFAYLFF